MTLREREAFLWDMLQAARTIETFIDGKGLDEYKDDELLRSAVGRQFLIIGEAAAQAVRRYPELQREIRQVARIVAFRNRLIHGYAVISDDVVWAIEPAGRGFTPRPPHRCSNKARGSSGPLGSTVRGLVGQPPAYESRRIDGDGHRHGHDSGNDSYSVQRRRQQTAAAAGQLPLPWPRSSRWYTR